MVCVDIWKDRKARWMAVHVLRLQWESLRVTRVEHWHSEWMTGQHRFASGERLTMVAS